MTIVVVLVALVFGALIVMGIAAGVAAAQRRIAPVETDPAELHAAAAKALYSELNAASTRLEAAKAHYREVDAKIKRLEGKK